VGGQCRPVQGDGGWAEQARCTSLAR